MKLRVVAFVAIEPGFSGEDTSEGAENQGGEDDCSGEGHCSAIPSQCEEREVGGKEQNDHHDGHPRREFF